MRVGTLTLVGMMLLAGIARADPGLAVGPVVQQATVGLRASFDSGHYVMAAEGYQLPGHGERSRAELAVRLPLAIGSGTRIEPQLGILPIDYQSLPNAQHTLSVALVGTVGLTVRLDEALTLVLQPVRIEGRLARFELKAPLASMPAGDRSSRWELASWIGLRFGL